MQSNKNIGILIPAAGASSRMGRPKQLLKWKKTHLLGHAIETALQLNTKNVIVTLGANANQIAPSLTNLKISIFENPNWEKGLGNSIAYGVSSMINSIPELDGILIMLPDQPLVEGRYLNNMIDSFLSQEALIVASKYPKNQFGVPAIFRKNLFKKLSLLNSEKGAKDLMIKYKNKMIVLKEEPNLVDIDTADQYEQLYRANHQ